MLVLLLGDEHLLEQLAGAVIADLDRQRDHPVETPNRHSLDFEVALELIGDGLASVRSIRSRRAARDFRISASPKAQGP
jgi:hypothetical protein